MKLSRRTAVQLALALWAKAEDQAHQHDSPPASSTTYKLKFLTASEVTTIHRFAAVMIPPSPRSGGAASAHVETYIDHTLAQAAPSLQRTWRAGLATWAKAKDTDSTLAALAPNEFAPKSKDDQFLSCSRPHSPPPSTPPKKASSRNSATRAWPSSANTPATKASPSRPPPATSRD